jgi:hypothetical protein
MKTRLLFVLLAISISYSCEKNIDIALNNVTPKLVVEATIETDRPPVVILSSSLDYYSAVSPEILEGTFVHNAEVSITENDKTYLLREYTIDSNGVKLSFYSADITDTSNILLGKLNTTYSLLIKTNSNEYTATTNIPDVTKKIDSLFSRPVYESPDSTKVQVLVTATDPPGLGDYIRYYTNTNNDVFFPPYNSVFDDAVIDGITYTVPIQKGVNKNIEWVEDDLFFHKGDSITLKTCNINKATFDFCRTYEFALQSTGNPFSNPTKVIGNISNGALGYFGGYAPQYNTVVVSK